MINTKRNERGAIIVEVIAVIALLGVMGPLLFKQVLTRNEEVENINMASEIRTMKEALSSYILTNKQAILNDNSGCQVGVNVEDYLPVGMDSIVNDYLFLLCRVEGGSSTSPSFVQGFVVPTAAVLPEDMGLKRSARIANLIGSDGGIYYNNQINGTAGGWSLDGSMIAGIDGLGEELKQTLNDAGIKAVYLASTGMDTYVPEYIVEDYSAGFVTIPDDLAFSKMHASEYFAIGGGAKCYQKKHNTMVLGTGGYTVQNDEITFAGKECEPLFWVGTGKDNYDKQGNIYVKNSLSVGRKLDGSVVKEGVVIAPADSTVTDTKQNTAHNRIEVYDATGKTGIVIRGDGTIISGEKEISGRTALDGGKEALTISGTQIKTNIKAENANAAYQIDPAYTSVMHDIRLESRGGARLSDILPNYVSKDILTVSNTKNRVDVPSCPEGYAPAIVVTPTSWGGVSYTSSDFNDMINSDKIDISLSEENGLSGKHTHRVSDITLDSGVKGNIASSGLHVKITTVGGIDKSESPVKEEPDMDVTGKNWVVKFYYANSDGEASEENPSAHGLAHTYCVYDGSKFSNQDNKQR